MNLSDYVKAEHGRGAELARALEVNSVLVSQWANEIRQVPVERCVDIERATGGEVTCEELRPDKAAYFEYLRRGPSTNEPKPAEAA